LSIQREKTYLIWYCTWRNQKKRDVIHTGLYPTNVKCVPVNLNSHHCNLYSMWITRMWHRPPLYNRCDILCFQTIGSHIKSVTAYLMWF